MSETAVAPAADSGGNKLAAFEAQLNAYLPDIARVLPQGITPDRFAQVCMNAVLTSPDLLDAVTKHSTARRTFFPEALKCATDGLVPDGKEAAFTTFTLKEVGVVVKYMPMVAGIMKKVRNSGELRDLTLEVVYKGEEFKHIKGDEERIVHNPVALGEKRGDAIGAYAIARMKDGGVYREVMDEAQLQAVRNVSRAKYGPWNGPFADEMRKKTVLRRLAKRLPSSSDIAGVVMRDDDLYDLEQKTATPESEKPKGQAPSTREKMGLEPAAAVEPPPPLEDDVPI